MGRRCGDRTIVGGEAALHLVSAWASASGLVLGQVATDDRSNEITAIPALLRLVALDGCTVTIDAMGCQTAIGQEVVVGGTDYVLALKETHPTFYDLARSAFSDARASAGTALAPSPFTTLVHVPGAGHRALRVPGDLPQPSAPTLVAQHAGLFEFEARQGAPATSTVA